MTSFTQDGTFKQMSNDGIEENHLLSCHIVRRTNLVCLRKYRNEASNRHPMVYVTNDALVLVQKRGYQGKQGRRVE